MSVRARSKTCFSGKGSMFGKFWFICISIFATCTLSLRAEENYSIVFCYLGNVPSYVQVALKQARLFNPSCPIYFITNDAALKSIDFSPIRDFNITLVAAENLTISDAHRAFNARYETDLKTAVDRYFNERFLYIDDLVSQYNLENVFQIECDVMLYADLSEMVGTFRQHYKVGAPFDADDLGSVSFVYFSDRYSCSDFAHFLVEDLPNTDMWVIAHYYYRKKEAFIDFLPTIPTEYSRDFKLINRIDQESKIISKYHTHIEQFNSIFDSDYLGGYLQVNEAGHGTRVMYDPSYMSFSWVKDGHNRLVPYMNYKTTSFRINTLHVFLKNLSAFYSGNDSAPNIRTSPSRLP